LPESHRLSAHQAAQRHWLRIAILSQLLTADSFFNPKWCGSNARPGGSICQERRCELRVKVVKLLAAAVVAAYSVPAAQAGVIRSLGHKIKGGSEQATAATLGAGETAGKATTGAVTAGAHSTKEGVAAVGGGAAAVGVATEEGAKSGATAVKKGAVTTAKGAEEAPGAAAHGIEEGAKSGATAVKKGAVTTAKGAEEAPRAAAQGIKAGANKVWKAIW
jgi:hypothetical protein